MADIWIESIEQSDKEYHNYLMFKLNLPSEWISTAAWGKIPFITGHLWMKNIYNPNEAFQYSKYTAQ